MPAAATENPINATLRGLEAAEANLEKLERIFADIKAMIPDGICFGSEPKYDDRVRAYKDVLAALPKIDGWKPEHEPIELNALAQWRLDAKEIGELTAEFAADEEAMAPARELAEYRYRMNKKRRQLVRKSMLNLMADVDESLRALRIKIPETERVNQDVDYAEWETLKRDVRGIEILLGSGSQRPPRWGNLRRHLSFGLVQDFFDIVRLDWPEVKSGLSANLYDQDEPIPVGVTDLADLVEAEAQGPITTKLNWERMTDEDFERMLFTIISTTPGYENAEWLMHTNAPDRGRDLSVTRVFTDPLTGVMRSRVLIQCKHWLSKSVSVPDVALLKEQMTLWEPPKVDILIIATSGRFTTDAVQAIERHNLGDRALRIEMWPESRLESFVAKRPGLIAEFKLR